MLLAGLCCAQQVAPPDSFVAAGGSYNAFSRPVAAGWFTYGKLIDTGSATYLFTTEDVTSSRERPYTAQTSVRMGVATLLKKVGPLQFYGVVDGGGATAGTDSGGAASGGSFAVLQFGKKTWGAIVGFRILKTSIAPGTPKLYEAGFFKSFP